MVNFLLIIIIIIIIIIISVVGGIDVCQFVE
jgi:hypothetical protein